MNELFNGMLGKIAPGMCRLSMDGGIAIKTSNGYRTYDSNTGRLTNCSSFVFDIGEEFFFVMPTNKVKTGDIIRSHCAKAGLQWSGTFEMIMRTGAGSLFGISGSFIIACFVLPCSRF